MTRLLDSAGIAFGMGSSVIANGNGPSGGYPDRVRNQRQHGIWVLERYAAIEGGMVQPRCCHTRLKKMARLSGRLLLKVSRMINPT